MNENNLQLDKIISDVVKLPGIDTTYILDSNYSIIKEKNISNAGNYLEQVLNIIKQEPVSNKIGSDVYSSNFHTYTLLNEAGLIVISKINTKENLYMVVIGGQAKPVDLVNLLKICKKARDSFKDT